MRTWVVERREHRKGEWGEWKPFVMRWSEAHAAWNARVWNEAGKHTEYRVRKYVRA